MISSADRLAINCEAAIQAGRLDDARKLAHGVAILSGQDAWKRAYDFLIDDENVDAYLRLKDLEIPADFAPMLHALHDAEGLEFKDQSAKGGTQVRLDAGLIFDWIEALAGKVIGAWSTRLKTGGYHVPHIHPRGEISHVVYLETGAGGEIDFGVTRFRMAYPKRTLHPVRGLWLTFPCWLWHAVRPNLDEKPRLTLAFDTHAA